MKEDPTLGLLFKFPVMNLFRLKKKDAIGLNRIGSEVNIVSSFSLLKKHGQVEIVFVRMVNV